MVFHSRPQSLRSFWPATGIESSGSNHFEITKEITEFCPSGLAQASSMAHARNGCSQSSRFLPQARRIVGSGDKNDGLCEHSRACELSAFIFASTSSDQFYLASSEHLRNFKWRRSSDHFVFRSAGISYWNVILCQGLFAVQPFPVAYSQLCLVFLFVYILLINREWGHCKEISDRGLDVLTKR